MPVLIKPKVVEDVENEVTVMSSEKILLVSTTFLCHCIQEQQVRE